MKSDLILKVVLTRFSYWTVKWEYNHNSSIPIIFNL